MNTAANGLASRRGRFGIGWWAGMIVVALDAIGTRMPPPGRLGWGLLLIELGLFPLAAGGFAFLVSRPTWVRRPQRLAALLGGIVICPRLLLMVFPRLSFATLSSATQWSKLVVIITAVVLMAREVGRWRRSLSWLSPPVLPAILAGAVVTAAGAAVLRVSEPASPAARRQATGRGPNVLLVTLDTVRRDAVGCYGGDPTASPTLDSLATTGMRFTKVSSCAPWTLASVSSIMTGLYPSTTRVFTGQNRLADGLTTMAEVFAANGYYTHAIVTNAWLREQFGLSQGFSTFDHRTQSEPRPELYHITLFRATRRFIAPQGLIHAESATDVVQRAAAFIESAPPEPWFLWLHFNDVHDPYAPPWPYLPRDRTYRGRFRITSGRIVGLREGNRTTPEDRTRLESLYRAELRYVDANLAAFFARLRHRGLERRTAVAVVSDHGEEFWEHGSVGHGHTLYEELTSVPFLISFPPEVPAGFTCRAPCTLADVAPTLLGLAGLTPPVTHGMPLTGTAPPEARSRISEALEFFWELKAVTVGEWKLIMDPNSGDVRLFNLDKDPGERADRAAEHPDLVAALRDTLSSYLVRFTTDADRLHLGEDAATAVLSPKLRAQLRAQGYLE